MSRAGRQFAVWRDSPDGGATFRGKSRCGGVGGDSFPRDEQRQVQRKSSPSVSNQRHTLHAENQQNYLLMNKEGRKCMNKDPIKLVGPKRIRVSKSAESDDVSKMINSLERFLRDLSINSSRLRCKCLNDVIEQFAIQ